MNKDHYSTVTFKRINNKLILWLVFMLITLSSIAQKEYQLKNLGIKDGLSNNEVTAITQDKQGFIWIGTRGGLNKYDGHQFVNYQKEEENGLSSSSIEALFVDSRGTIWIGTKNRGLDSFDPASEIFTNYPLKKSNPSSLTQKRIIQIFEDKKGSIWAVGRNHGLYRQINDSTFENHAEHLSVRKVIEDDKGFFWIAAEYTGLVMYNPTDRSATTVFDVPSGIITIEKSQQSSSIYVGTWKEGFFEVDLSDGYFKNPKIIPHKLNESINDPRLNDTYSLLSRKNGELWVGTWGKGLRVWNGSEDEYRFSKEYFKKQTLSNDIVLTIFEDKSGLIWVGTDGGGVNIFKSNQSGFKNLGFDYSDSTSLSNEVIMSVIKSTDQSYLIGTKGGGVNNVTLGKINQVIRLNQPKFLDEFYTGKNNISAMLQDSHGTLWLGDLDFGLYHLYGEGSITQKSFESLRPDEGHIQVGGIKITALAEDKKGYVWVGTQRHGISRITLANNGEIDAIHHESFENYGEQTRRITSIIPSKNLNHIWIATYNGLIKYSPDQMEKKGETNSLQLLNNEIIVSVYEDAQGIVWAGTPNGLWQISWDESGKMKQKKWTTQEGLSFNYIQGLTGVKKDANIWISTSDGLNVLNCETGAIKSYTEDDGLIGDSFLPNAIFNDKQGLLFFGTTKGLIYFHVDSLSSNNNISTPQFTDLILNDDTHVDVGKTYYEEVILDQAIGVTHVLELNYHIRKFTLAFSSQNYFSQNQVNYSYQLKGYENRWVNQGSKNYASFTNLDPGDYVFRVKLNNETAQSNLVPLEMRIKILPAPWRTGWAYVGYTILGVLIIVGLLWMFIRQNHLTHKLKTETVLREKEYELHQLKLRFFTNISHELRTPLTLISAPLEEILHMTDVSSVIQEKAHLIKRNVKSLLRLSDQLITFRKIETRKMNLVLSKIDIVSFCEEIYNLFKLSSDDEKYTFKFDSEIERCDVYVDTEKLEIILLNLISNAVKFSDDEGAISIRILKHVDFITIQIEDNGIGISEQNLARIFERFYQLGDSRSNTGVGIGLALAQSLVHLHKGQVSVRSTEGIGSTFSIQLSTNDTWFETLNYAQLSNKEETNLRANYWQEEFEDLFKSQQFEHNEPILEASTQILIVDDNKEMVDYLVQLFEGRYRCKKAFNGQEALDILKNEIIELVLADVMMPKVNGVELCKSIKNDHSLSHIPVIMLSAKTEIEDQLQGLQTGADDYIEKPFNPELLKAKVSTRLQKIHEIREYYRQEFLLKPTDVEVSNPDEQFILDLKNIVERNISDTHKIKLMIKEEIAMSKATLYRKLKSVTGYSLSEFIKVIRINLAAQHLTTSQMSISETAYAVGFNDLKYFRVCFESVHHMTPSEYRKSKKENIEALPLSYPET